MIESKTKCPECGDSHWAGYQKNTIDVEIGEDFEMIDNGCDVGADYKVFDIHCASCGFRPNKEESREKELLVKTATLLIRLDKVTEDELPEWYSKSDLIAEINDLYCQLELFDKTIFDGDC
jgi:hypothetical protein